VLHIYIYIYIYIYDISSLRVKHDSALIRAMCLILRNVGKRGTHDYCSLFLIEVSSRETILNDIFTQRSRKADLFDGRCVRHSSQNACAV